MILMVQDQKSLQYMKFVKLIILEIFKEQKQNLKNSKERIIITWIIVMFIRINLFLQDELIHFNRDI